MCINTISGSANSKANRFCFQDVVSFGSELNNLFALEKCLLEFYSKYI